MFVYKNNCHLSKQNSAFRVPFLLQALVMKVGMDSIMASYFALFEVINHSFGKICGHIQG